MQTTIMGNLMIKQITRITALIILCASSLTFAMEPQNIKIESLQTLAMKAVLKNPRILITEPLPIPCEIMAHELLAQEIKQSTLATTLDTKAAQKFNAITLGMQMLLTKEIKTFTMKQLCLLSMIEKRHITKQKQLTEKEIKLLNNLPRRLYEALTSYSNMVKPPLRQRIHNAFKL
jgi:hypothetical protein